MLDHVSLGTRDLDRAAAFYGTLLAAIGYTVQNRSAEEVALGPGEHWAFVLYPAAPGSSLVGERMHVAFRAESRGAAKAFEAEALALGAQPVREVAERPQFGADYFGGVFRDLDGHTIEVLTRSAT